jgi:hypothetical protein
LLGRELWLSHWVDFGNVEPEPQRADALVSWVSAIHSNADQGSVLRQVSVC